MNEKSLMQKVIEYLKFHPGAKPAEIADYLGVSLKLVRAILSRLRARGFVIRTDKGYFLRPGVEIVGEVVSEEISEEKAGEMISEEVGVEVKPKTLENIPRQEVAQPLSEAKPGKDYRGIEVKAVPSLDIEKISRDFEEIRSYVNTLGTRLDEYVKDVDDLKTGMKAVEHRLEETVKKVDEVLTKITTLENTVNQLLNDLNLVKNTLQSIQPIQRRDRDIATNLTQCFKDLSEAIDIIKMVLESIVLGDTSSFNSLLRELEDIVEKLKKCSKHV